MSAVPPVGITPIQSVPSIGNVSPAGQVGGAKPGSNLFSTVVDKVVGQANQHLQSANQSVDKLAKGETDDFQSVVMSMAKADLSFRFVMEIRNKLMDAYQEIMRMQV